MLEIENLSVSIEEKEILHNLNLKIPEGEVHALFGPNGSGKTTLIKTIIGYPEYEITSGSIRFKGQELAELDIDERVNLGIGVSEQRPPSIKGVKVGDLLGVMKQRDESRAAYIDEMVEKYNMGKFIDRDINEGFSGGEIKLSELFYILLNQPDFLMFDEPDSGVDTERMAKLGEMANECLKSKNCPNVAMERNSGLIITHTGFILDYIHADKAHLLLDGTIVCNGNPGIMLDQIRSEGFDFCVQCQRRVMVDE
jgi:Fe-S cluster assembly ATP-binding protein